MYQKLIINRHQTHLHSEHNHSVMSEKQSQAASKEANGKPIGKKALLLDYVDKKVSVITNDGRNVIGTLLGFDQVCNIVLDKSIERVFAPNTGVQVVNLGLYVIRGDNIAVLGEVNLEKDANIAWDKTKVRHACQCYAALNLA